MPFNEMDSGMEYAQNILEGKCPSCGVMYENGFHTSHWPSDAGIRCIRFNTRIESNTEDKYELAYIGEEGVNHIAIFTRSDRLDEHRHCCKEDYEYFMLRTKQIQDWTAKMIEEGVLRRGYTMSEMMDWPI